MNIINKNPRPSEFPTEPPIKPPTEIPTDPPVEIPTESPVEKPFITYDVCGVKSGQLTYQPRVSMALYILR